MAYKARILTELRVKVRMLFVALLIAGALATVPEHVVFLCGEGADCARLFVHGWLSAAQEEAARSYHTLNGGWLESECCGPDAPVNGPEGRVKPFPVDLHAVLCIAHSSFPNETCASKKCDFESHPELYQDDCTETENPDDDESCRTIESWLDIAKWLLLDALEYTEQCEWDKATSAACAAEFLYRTINEWTLATYSSQSAKLRFINANARAQQRYTHINSPLRTLTFNSTLFTTQLRVVQSSRHCGTCADDSAEPVTSLLVYSRTTGDPDTLATTQLIWALSGVLSDFGTLLPFDPANECGLQHVHSNLPIFSSARRVPHLSPVDWATVRCDGAPRETTDLRIESSCPTVLLFASLGPGSPDDELHSLAQLQLRDGFAPLAPLAAAQLVEGALALRVATGTGGECHDYSLLLAASVYENCTAVEQPLSAISSEHQSQVPLTLAPGVSRCVGGTADGSECEALSECGVGLACRRKPFEPDDVAFCYDGITWHADKPCAFADEDASCPYGSCVGAVNGFDGGLFPMLHFHQESECGGEGAGGSACQHDAVASWHKYPNLALFNHK